MKLKKILKHIGTYDIDAKNDDIIISHAAWDTRLLRPGGLYVLRSGSNFNPLTKLDQIKKSAVVIIAHKEFQEPILSKKNKNEKIVYIFVDNLAKVSDYLVEAFSVGIDKLRFVGVTGTNGKTTVTKILRHLFDKNKQKSAVIGTIEYAWGRTSINAFMTTPDRENFSTLCTHMLAAGVKNVFMEVSSHALALGRVNIVELDGAAFTNLSPEHLDYHKTMDEYAQAKAKIHDLLKVDGVALVNADNHYSLESAKYSDRKCLSFGIKAESDYKISSFRLNQDSLEFIYEFENKKDYIKTNLIGYFNLENSLAAIGLAHQLGLTRTQIATAFKTLKAPCGRIEKVATDVFVDYAHTADALDKCLASIRELGYENIVTVFGCGGNRDKSKRKEMGKVADSYSKKIIITDDNPRDENPQEIVEQITVGIKETDYVIIHDRKKAIGEGLASIKSISNCALLIAGKGHEMYQLTKGVKTHFSDQEVVKEMCA